MNSQEISGSQMSVDFGLNFIFGTQESEDTLLASQKVPQVVTEPKITEGKSVSVHPNSNGKEKGKGKSYGPVQAHKRLVKSAEFIIKKFNGVEALSSANLQSLEWAKSVLLQEPPKPSSSVTVPSSSKTALRQEFGKKRDRSEDEVPQVSSKKRVTAAKRPTTFRDAAKESLKIAVLDKNVIDGKIPDEKWELLTAGLRNALFELCDNANAIAPQFDAMSWCRGVRVIDCSNQYTLDFVKSTISALGSLWEGSNLVVIPKDEIPDLVRGRIFVPPPRLEVTKFLKLLAFQNNGLPADELRFVREEPKENGQIFVFEFGKRAEQYIADRDNKLIFTMGLVHCSFFSSKAKKPLQKGDVTEVDVRENRDASSGHEEGADKPDYAKDCTN